MSNSAKIPVGTVGPFTKISRLVLGTSDFGALSSSAVFAVCDAAVERGINTFDTGIGFLDGASARALGAWIQERKNRDQVFVLAKGATFRNNMSSLSEKSVHDDIERLRSALGVEALDMFVFDRDDPRTAPDEAMDEVDHQRKHGHVRALGAANWTAARIEVANAYAATNGLTKISASMPQWSLLTPRRPIVRGAVSLSGRDGASDRAICERLKIPVLAWSTLAGGMFSFGAFASVDAMRGAVGAELFEVYGSRENMDRITRVHTLAKKLGVAPVAIAAAYTLSAGSNHFAIIRSSRSQGVNEIAGAANVELSGEDRAWLEDGFTAEERRDERERAANAPNVARDTVYDAIIVGAGAAGAWAAKELTEGGLHVLVLEAGPELEPMDLDVADGRAVARRAELGERQRVQSIHMRYLGVPAHLFVDDVASPYGTNAAEPFVWIRGQQVGGRAHIWGGNTLRFSDLDFAGGDGAAPTWPICHADLAEPYAKVEKFLGVAGMRDGVTDLPDGEFEAPLELSPGEAHVKGIVERTWPGRRLIANRGIPTSRVDEDNVWMGSMLPVVAAARKTGKLTLRPETFVREVTWDSATRRATGVSCIDRNTREEVVYRAKTVVLCAGAIETARILLQSTSHDFPTGLGNTSDVLGRYLMANPHFVLSGRTQAAFNVPELQRRHLLSATALIPRAGTERGKTATYARGFGVLGCVGRDADERGAFAWFIPQGEMLPRAENRVSLIHGFVDSWGLPAPFIRCEYGDNERAMGLAMGDFIHELGHRAGITFSSPPVGLAAPGMLATECGTVRMGSDAKTSFLDKHNRSWEVPNLYVTDGASFPSSPWQDPTLTVMAMTVRACGEILRTVR